MSFVEFLENIGKYVAYYPAMNHITGSVVASILLYELIFWDNVAEDEDGVDKTEAEISAALGFTPTEIRKARKDLVENKLIVEKRKGVPARLYLKPVKAELDDRWRRYHAGELESASLRKRKEKAARLQGIDRVNGQFAPNTENKSSVNRESSFPQNGDLITTRVSDDNENPPVHRNTENLSTANRSASPPCFGELSIYKTDLKQKEKQKEKEHAHEENEPKQPFSLEPEKTVKPVEPEQPLPKETSLPESTSQSSSVSTKDLGSDRQEATARREIVMSTVYSDPRYNSATRMEDAWNARTTAPEHAYPMMVKEGFGHLWIGKSKNERTAFDPYLIQAVQASQKKCKLPDDRAFALTMIKNCIKRLDWTQLEIYEELAKEIKENARQIEATRAQVEAQPSSSPANVPSDEPVRPSDEPKNLITPHIQNLIDETRRKMAESRKEKEKRDAQLMRDRYNGTLPRPQ